MENDYSRVSEIEKELITEHSLNSAPKGVHKKEGFRSHFRRNAQELLNKNIIILAAVNFLIGFGYSSYWVIFQPYFLEIAGYLGEDTAMVLMGTILTLSSFLTMIGATVSGYLCDLFGRKTVLLIGIIVIISGFTMFSIKASLPFVIAGPLLFNLGYGWQEPPQRMIMAESVGEKVRGTAFSVVSLFSSIAGVIAPILISVFTRINKHNILFFRVTLVLIVISLGLALIFIADHFKSEDREQSVSLKSIFSILREKWVLAITLLFMIDFFAWGIGVGTTFGIFKEEFGFTTEETGYLTLTQNIVWILLTIPFGFVTDKFGAKLMLILGELAGAAWITLLIVFYFKQFFVLLIIAYLFMGTSMSLYFPAQYLLIVDVGKEKRAKVYSTFAFFKGLGSIPSAVVASAIYSWLGYFAPLLATAVWIPVSILLFVKFANPYHQSQQNSSKAIECTG